MRSIPLCISRNESILKASSLNSQFRRAGEILRRGASAQISDYTRRFDSVKDIYDGLLKDLIRDSFSGEEATVLARRFFESERVAFAAVDGTEYTRPLFDLVIFFGGSYAAKGIIEFKNDRPKIEYSTKFAEDGMGVSSCVPMYVNEIVDVEQAYMALGERGNVTVDKPLTDEEVVNNSTIANWIMTFSEFFLAYKLAKQGDYKILLLDRSLCTMYGSLVYDTRRKRVWSSCALIDCDLGVQKVDGNDLAYNRHRLVNHDLRLPPARGDYLRYSLVYLLEEKGPLTIDRMCKELGMESEDRRRRVSRFLKRSVEEGYLWEKSGLYKVSPQYSDSWSRVKSLVEVLGRRLFEDSGEAISGNPMQVMKNGEKCWLTTLDFAFLSLFCFYMLVEECWTKNILLLGITKDTTARDFKTHLIPVCLGEEVWRNSPSLEELEKAPNTDRMLLQYVSIYNCERLRTPWSLIEYDSAFRMIIPELEKRRRGYVSGAIRNRITPERTFLKTYVQLSEARNDPKLRSIVLFIDRLAYPEYDLRSDSIISFRQDYGGAVEPVEAILFRNKGMENVLQNLVIVMLKAMADSSIPEVFGHNMPLFIADSAAKWHNSEVRRIIDSTEVWIANNRDLRRFIFYMNTFRERRSELEQGRRVE
ncbi:MAG: hypothetical protein QG670_639 [Thermoproteota archaeon]|nr:hypothetical protein [Thermoproteota archaeon]